jgi:tetratricopeptide (TPR) repeat protein
MKSPLARLACCFLMCPLLASAQGRSGGGTGGGRPTNPSGASISSTPQMPTPDVDRPIFISGKVVLADGSQLTEPAAIESVCDNRKRIETYTDSHGSFSFELQKKTNTMAPQSADMSSSTDDVFKSNNPFQYQNCEILAVLPGFSSDTVQLAGFLSSTMESTDIGRVTLHQMGPVDASILSATSLSAPNSARKEMDKAHEQEKKNKMDDARQSLQRAVEIYPQYAAAWSELGRLQYANHDIPAAQHSYEQALAADPKYAKPYLGLAQLVADSGQWQQLVDLTAKLLTLNSVNFPAAWYLNGVGHYSLQDYPAAENSIRSGLKIDTDHRFPRLEHMLALILAHKHDYAQAAEHMHEFLKWPSPPAEIAQAQKQLAEIERLSANAQLSAAPQK